MPGSLVGFRGVRHFASFAVDFLGRHLYRSRLGRWSYSIKEEVHSPCREPKRGVYGGRFRSAQDPGTRIVSFEKYLPNST